MNSAVPGRSENSVDSTLKKSLARDVRRTQEERTKEERRRRQEEGVRQESRVQLLQGTSNPGLCTPRARAS